MKLNAKEFGRKYQTENPLSTTEEMMEAYAEYVQQSKTKLPESLKTNYTYWKEMYENLKYDIEHSKYECLNCGCTTNKQKKR